MKQLKLLNKNKLNKSDLESDSVNSDSIHVGIELELIAPNSSEREHDDSACAESASQSHRDSLESASLHTLLNDYCGQNADRDLCRFLERIGGLNISDIIDQEVESYESDHDCDDSDCCFWSESDDGDCGHETLRDDLQELTGNASFKVVSDGSISHNSGESDAEVCWNYFISKDTIKDNTKIMTYLKSKEMRFNKSCGLHINLNNYLEIPQLEIATSELSFLFNFVSDSTSSTEFILYDSAFLIEFNSSWQ